MKKFLLGLFLLMCIQFVNAQRTIIYCGQLIDVKTLQVQKEMSVIIIGNTITDVQKGYTKAEASDKIIDLKSKTVMPGLMDMHVHVEKETSPSEYLDEFTKNKSDLAYVAIGLVQKDFMAGFTTLRDLGGSGVNISLRNAINKGLIMGPRIYTSGIALASTGGHGDPTNNYREDLMRNPGPDEGVVNGIADCAKAVRMCYKTGADLIKITATGGVLSMAKDGSGAQFTEEEIRAIVTTAKDYGFKVAAHAHGAEGMKRAVLAGVNSIEHGTYMSEEVMELMKQHGTYLVPTIIAGKSSADSAKIPGYFPEIVRAKAAVVGNYIQATFAKAYKAGVKIAFGTDAGVYAHGKNWLEFVYMSEAGMPILECIKSATVNAADLLGVSDILGSIEKGKYADIIAVDGDPTKDVQVMGKVSFVMKNGVVYKN